MKIDIFTHIVPMKYKEALHKIKAKDKIAYELELIEGCSTLFDVERRFRILDKFEISQVLTIISPPIEDIAAPDEAVILAQIANDGMAELIQKYPEYFVAGVASLPLNNIEASLDEIDRAINELNFRGVLMHSSIQEKAIDSKEFFPIFEKMQAYNLPIWLHPWRVMKKADYNGEDESKYKIWSTFGWPYETSAAMTRFIFGGVLEKFPDLKVITHHAGGMVPFFSERIRSGYDLWETRTSLNPMRGLTKSPLDYFRKFYADTAIAGYTPALKCAYDFFGAGNILFGTDMPMDSQMGFRLVRDTITSIEKMDIPKADKKKIYEDNARDIMRLPV